MRGFKIQKKQHPKDTVISGIAKQRASDSPEPEGSEMMLHHSAFIIAKRF